MKFFLNISVFFIILLSFAFFSPSVKSEENSDPSSFVKIYFDKQGKIAEVERPAFLLSEMTKENMTILALQLLIKGPSEKENQDGLKSGISCKTKILGFYYMDIIYPESKKLILLDLSKEIISYGGGSYNVELIRSQFNKTLEQFYDDEEEYDELIILVEGELALQP